MTGEPRAIPGLPGFRDLGGHTTADGRTVRGQALYRSGALHSVDDADKAALAALGISTVIDLRTDGERKQRPDKLPDGARLVVADVLADTPDPGPATFRDLVSMPSALRAYRALFLEVTEDSSRPAVFHCASGVIRTGWATASTLLLLGVSEDDVLAGSPDGLKEAIDEMNKTYGSIEGYFTVGLGIGPGGQEELRTALLV